MSYLEWGDARNRDVLVCVHGLTRSGRDFDELARALCAQWRVICPDIAGAATPSGLPTRCSIPGRNTSPTWSR